MQSLKHVGRIKATGRKCLVAFRTLPGDAYSALVIATENLDESSHDALINLVEGPSAQSAYEFAEVLDRSQFPNGSRMLPALHATGRLLKVSTDQVEMTPTTTSVVLLSELNQMIAEQRGIAVDELHIPPGSNDKVEVVEVTRSQEVPASSDAAKTTSASVNNEVATPTSFDSPEAEAKFYRSQADRLAKEAAAFRRKAEELVPTQKRPAAK